MGKYASALWRDVKPIPLIDGSFDDATAGPALATIAYAPAYSEAMSYLRAVMAANEFSDRVLDLTADIISMNPAHYTVWLYRSRTLRELGKDVHEELEWLEGISARYLKNYQIWHHRQTIITTLPTLPPSEPALITRILSLDTKNYHVWAYRQWLCTRFPDAMLHSPAELARTETLIDSDVRNNSAWNHRWFLVFGAEDVVAKEKAQSLARMETAAASEGEGDAEPNVQSLPASMRGTVLAVVDEDIVDREVAYAESKIRLAPQNASPWNYLRGVMRRAGRPLADLEEFCLEFVGAHGDVEAEGKDRVRSSHAVEILAEIWTQKGEKERAEKCWDMLGRKWDPIRWKYWDYRKRLAFGGGSGDENGSGVRSKVGSEMTVDA